MNVKKIVIGTVMTLGLITSAQATQLVGVDESTATNLCVTAAAGNRAMMYNTIKSSGHSSKFIVNNIKCNGDNLLSFVEHNGKNSVSMLKMLHRANTSVTITDLAKNTLEEK